MATPVPRSSPPWWIPSVDTSRAGDLAKRLSVPSLLAHVLVSRGHGEVDAAKRFLNPDWQALRDPFGLKDMDVAVERIRRALLDRERILVFGDYDVDGITATTLVSRLFAVLGHPVQTFIPDRLSDGYGVTPAAADRIIARGDIDLVITVDCGVSDVAGVERLVGAGIDVIVTDHHVAPPTLPKATAVVNPMRADCTYPFKRLAGVGVAFKLAAALTETLSPRRQLTEEFRTFLLEATGLVALGTVCDVVPLIDENRVFTHFGLTSLVESPNPGLRALLEVSGLIGKTLEPHHLGFKVGPRLNAAGRMGSPDDALNLLTATSYQQAIDLAGRLDQLNTRRQALERGMLNQVTRSLRDGDADPAAGVVLTGKGWSPGITGIVASRLVDAHRAPAVLIAVRDGIGRGSGRSIAGLDLLEIVETLSSHLSNHGGHPRAVGFSIHEDKVETFAAALREKIAERMASHVPPPTLRIDAMLDDIHALEPGTVAALRRLAPFGEGNPPPLLLARGLNIPGHPRAIGRARRSMRLLLSTDTASPPVPATIQQPGLTPDQLKALSPCDAALIPDLKAREIQMRIKAIQPAAAQDTTA